MKSKGSSDGVGVGDDSGLDDDAMDDRSETSEPSAGVTASSAYE
jgi:hypothetical protein